MNMNRRQALAGLVSLVGAATFIGFVSGILGFCSGLFLSRAIRALKLRRGVHALMRRARIGSTAGAAPTR